MPENIVTVEINGKKEKIAIPPGKDTQKFLNEHFAEMGGKGTAPSQPKNTSTPKTPSKNTSKPYPFEALRRQYLRPGSQSDEAAIQGYTSSYLDPTNGEHIPQRILNQAIESGSPSRALAMINDVKNPQGVGLSDIGKKALMRKVMQHFILPKSQEETQQELTHQLRGESEGVVSPTMPSDISGASKKAVIRKQKTLSNIQENIEQKQGSWVNKIITSGIENANEMGPAYDITAATQPGRWGAVQHLAAGVLESLPQLAVAGGVGAAGGLAKTAIGALFTTQMGKGLIDTYRNEELRNSDPKKWQTELGLQAIMLAAAGVGTARESIHFAGGEAAGKVSGLLSEAPLPTTPKFTPTHKIGNTLVADIRDADGMPGYVEGRTEAGATIMAPKSKVAPHPPSTTASTTAPTKVAAVLEKHNVKGVASIPSQDWEQHIPNPEYRARIISDIIKTYSTKSLDDIFFPNITKAATREQFENHFTNAIADSAKNPDMAKHVMTNPKSVKEIADDFGLTESQLSRQAMGSNVPVDVYANTLRYTFDNTMENVDRATSKATQNPSDTNIQEARKSQLDFEVMLSAFSKDKNLMDRAVQNRQQYNEVVNRSTAETAETQSAVDQVISPDKAPKNVEPHSPGFGSNNTYFTRDRFSAAMENLKKATYRANVGIPPETLEALYVAGGYVIEAGARTLADFKTTMIQKLKANGKDDTVNGLTNKQWKDLFDGTKSNATEFVRQNKPVSPQQAMDALYLKDQKEAMDKVATYMREKKKYSQLQAAYKKSQTSSRLDDWALLYRSDILANPAIAAKILVAHAIYLPITWMSDTLGAGAIDAIFSIGSKYRTQYIPSGFPAIQGVIKGAGESIRMLRGLGKSEHELETLHAATGGKKGIESLGGPTQTYGTSGSYGHKYSWLLNKWSNAVFGMHGAAVRPVKVGFYARSMAEQIAKQIKYEKSQGLLTNPAAVKTRMAQLKTDSAMNLNALGESQIGTFMGENWLTKGINKGTQDMPPAAKLAANLLAPIRSVPTNLLFSLWDYTPGSAVPKIIYDTVNRMATKGKDPFWTPEFQSRLSRTLSRNLTGAGAGVMMGYLMASRGELQGYLHTGKDQKDASLLMFGMQIPIGEVYPFGPLMAAGASLYEARNYDISPSEMHQGLKREAIDIFGKIPFMHFGQILEDRDPQRSVNREMGGYIWNLMPAGGAATKTLGQAIDPSTKTREAKKFWEYFIENMPKVREGLPESDYSNKGILYPYSNVGEK